MALKLIKVAFPGGATGTVYTNISSAFILIISVSVHFPSGSGVLYILDEAGNAVGDLIKVYNFGISGSITGSNSFSTSASTSQGITSTTENVNQSLSSQQFSHQVFTKGLLAYKYQLSAYQVTVYGFLAIQADSLEELRGFL